MGYVGETNHAIVAGGGADLLWALKSALLKANWRLMSYGTGTGGTYVAPDPDGVSSIADGLTTPSSLNVNGAWFRMKEPGTTTVGREYVFMRCNAATTISIKYSRATGFTDGTPNATTSPTTGTGGDGVVVTHTATDSAATVGTSGLASATATSGYIQAVAGDTADANGVWSFYAWSYADVTAVTTYIFATEGTIPGSHHPADGDTSYFLTLNPATHGAGVTNIVSWWHGYGRPSGVYIGPGTSTRVLSHPGIWGHLGIISGIQIYGPRAIFNRVNSSFSVIDGNIIMFPFGINRTNTTATLRMWKGITSNIVGFGTNQSNADTFGLLSSNAKIAIWTGGGSRFAVPWVTGINPLI